jgi:hypothetical protein
VASLVDADEDRVVTAAKDGRVAGLILDRPAPRGPRGDCGLQPAAPLIDRDATTARRASSTISTIKPAARMASSTQTHAGVLLSEVDDDVVVAGAGTGTRRVVVRSIVCSTVCSTVVVRITVPGSGVVVGASVVRILHMPRSGRSSFPGGLRRTVSTGLREGERCSMGRLDSNTPANRTFSASVGAPVGARRVHMRSRLGSFGPFCALVTRA